MINVEIIFADKKSVLKALDKNGTMYKDNIINIIPFLSNKESTSSIADNFKNNKIDLNRDDILNENNSYIPSDEEDEHSDTQYDGFIEDYRMHLKSIVKSKKKSLSIPGGQVDISELLSQANSLYINNDYDKAILVLHEIIKAAPGFQEPYLILSMIHEERNDLQKATSFLMLAAKLSHRDEEIWMRCAVLNKQIKNYRQAEYCLARAVRIKPNNPYYLYERGFLNEELGNLKKAVLLYEKVFSLQPNLEMLLNISKIYEKLNNIDKSIENLENNYHKLLKLKIVALIKLFDMYIFYNYWSKGVQLYESFISLQNEDNNQILNNTGLKKLSKSDLNLITNNSELKIRYLLCSLEITDFSDLKINSERIVDEIINEFEKILKIDEDKESIGLINALFNILSRNGKVERYILIFEKLEENINSNDEYDFEPEVYYKIGEYFLNNNNNNYNQNDNSDNEKALKYFKKCLIVIMRKNGNSSNVITNNNYYDMRVSAKLKMSEIYNKMKDYNKALEILNSDNIDNINTKFNTNKNNDKDKCSNEIVTNINNNYSANINNEIEEDLNSQFNSNYQDDTNMHFISNQIMEEEDRNDVLSIGEINQDESVKNNNNFEFLPPYNIKKKTNFIYQDLYFSDIISTNSFNSSKKKNTLIGNKRLRLISSDHLKMKSIKNYNFDSFLKRKMLNKKLGSNISSDTNDQKDISNSSYSIKPLNILRIEYEELKNELNNTKNYYLKLQESLLYLQMNDIENFLNKTFTPLREVLLQELKIEIFKNGLFYTLLNKNIKHYKYKDTIFLENEEEYGDINLISKRDEEDFSNIYSSSNYSSTINNNNENNYNDSDQEFENENKKENNLFYRQPKNQNRKEKKKIRKTLYIVDKQINKLQNIDKFINEENMNKIITKFIENSYLSKKYEESNIILCLVLNSENFINKNYSTIFNLLIYAMLNNLKLKNFKNVTGFLKRIIINYDLKDQPIFWIFFKDIMKNLNLDYARNFFYKLMINTKSMMTHPYLNKLLGNCYFQTRSWDHALQCFKNANEFQKDKLCSNPLYFLENSLAYISKAIGRKEKKSEEMISLSLQNINYYALIRNKDKPFEVLFNLGRFYQFMKLDKEAYNKYDDLMSKIFNTDSYDSESNENYPIYLSSLYNYVLLLKKTGNDARAHKFIMDNIKI